MIFVKISRGGGEVNMVKSLSKINLSKIGQEGGGSLSIWTMSVNIQGFFWTSPLTFSVLGTGPTEVTSHIKSEKFKYKKLPHKKKLNK